MNSPTDLSQLTSQQQRALLARLLQEKAAAARRYPMSLGQQGLWHAYRRDPHSTAFNVFLPTRMRAPIDVATLQAAMRWVAARHHCLHTVFADVEGKLLQVVKPDLQPGFHLLDLSAASEHEAQRLFGQLVRQPLDLEQGPLLQLHCGKLADDDWIILALTHHIVVDFWSLVIILKELRDAYPAFARQQVPDYPPPQNNYAQFVRDQTELLQSPRAAAHREYWQAVVAAAAPVIELPTDKLRPAVFENAAISTTLEFPQVLSTAISQLATTTRATPFSVVHAALQVFLSRYSGQQKFLIGSPFAGRQQQAYEQTVGFFVNMLPLLADLDGNPTFSQLIKRTQAQLLGALEHEAYPIAQIVHDVSAARDPARSPLFQVSCTFEKSHIKSEAGRASFLFPNQQLVWDFAGMPQEGFYIPHPTCHYDLEFIFEQNAVSLQGMLVACQALFTPPMLQCMAQNFSSLLQVLVNRPDVPVAELAWPQTTGNVSSVQTTPQVAPTTHVHLPLPSPTTHHTLCHLMATAAATHRPRIALRSEQRQWTYGQFWEAAQRVAREVATCIRRREQRSIPTSRSDATAITAADIRASGGAIVPLCAPAGPSAMIGMLGIQLAGAAPAAIDIRQPSIEASTLWQQTQPTCWLGEPGQSYTQAWDRSQFIDLEQTLQESLEQPGQSRELWGTTVSSDDLAYLVFTSGSTGQPKGVLIEHGAVCNTLRWRTHAVPLKPSDRVLMLLSHQFDAALGITWSALTQGANVVWPDANAFHDPHLIIQQVLRDQITVLPAVPSLLRVLIAHPDFGRCRSLRFIFCGGEALPPELPSQLRQVSSARLWNFYGPSEAAIEAAAIEVSEHPTHLPVPLGYPIAHTQIVIVDQQQQPVPTSVPGELAIMGPGLARGYLNDAGLTQRKFTQLTTALTIDQQTYPAGTRMYLTGDRGRRLNDGRIAFLGRTDHQVKLRGYRIELGEIESAMQSCPAVDRAAVNLAEPGTDHARLVGYFSLRSSQDAPNTTTTVAGVPGPTAELKRFLNERLPAYKIPAQLVCLPSLPLNSSGKVDRAQLPLVPFNATAERPWAPAATKLEEFIARMWCENLAVAALGVDVNYFEAGGSSLGAAVLTTQLSQQLGIHVPTALLFDLADIRQVATRLAELHPASLGERFGEADIAQQLRLGHGLALQPTGGERLEAAATPTQPLLAALKPSGSRPAWFFVHPPGGIVMCYRELAQQLPPEQPLIAIRSRGLHGPEQLPQTLEAMANEYVQAIRQTQRDGPYFLGGWSLGGLIAYEIAQQLSRAGQRVGRLVLLDTTIPERGSDLVPAHESINVGREYGIELNLEQLGQLSEAEQLPLLWQHAKSLGIIDDASPAEVVARTLEDLRHLFQHHLRLASAYRLQPWDGAIDLVRPKEIPFAIPTTPDRGWRYLVRQVRVHAVSGHHHSMVQSPHVAQVAELLTRLSDDFVTQAPQFPATRPQAHHRNR